MRIQFQGQPWAESLPFQYMAAHKSQKQGLSLEGHLYDAFLSHYSGDKDQVEMLAARLEDEAGLLPFLDKWHLVPGEPWQEELERALENSAACAVFLGPSGLGPWQNEEMRSALDKRARNNSFRVIPVLLPRAKPANKKTLPRFLQRLTWVDFRAGLNDQEAFCRLVAGIRGKSPGRSLVIQKEPVKWVLVISGTIDDINKSRVQAMAAQLRELSGDILLTIQKIEKGSVKLFIKSSEEGLERIKSLFKQGQLRELLGREVLAVKINSYPGDLETAIQIIKDAADRATLSDFALLHYTQTEYVDGESVYQQALEIARKTLGSEHPHVATGLSNLALLYSARGEYEDAERLYKQALAIREKVLSEGHPDIATNLNNLATLYNSRGYYAEAESFLRQALAIWEKTIRPQSSSIAMALNNLAMLFPIRVLDTCSATGVVDEKVRSEIAQTVLSSLAQALTASESTKRDRTKDKQSNREDRLERAQSAIRQLMVLGFAHSQIADKVGVVPSTISHIMSSHDGPSVSEKLVVALEDLLPWAVSTQTQLPKGIEAAIASIGSDLYLIKLQPQTGDDNTEVEANRLRLLIHELEHLVQRLRENLPAPKRSHGPKSAF